MGKTVVTIFGLIIGLATIAVLASSNGDKLVSTFFSGSNNLIKSATAPVG
jgi:hypothetical protein